jgi:hypothetical protein
MILIAVDKIIMAFIYVFLVHINILRVFMNLYMVQMKVSGIKSAYVRKQSTCFPVVLLLVPQPQRNANMQGQSLAYLSGLGRRLEG